MLQYVLVEDGGFAVLKTKIFYFCPLFDLCGASFTLHILRCSAFAEERAWSGRHICVVRVCWVFVCEWALLFINSVGLPRVSVAASPNALPCVAINLFCYCATDKQCEVTNRKKYDCLRCSRMRTRKLFPGCRDSRCASQYTKHRYYVPFLGLCAVVLGFNVS